MAKVFNTLKDLLDAIKNLQDLELDVPQEWYDQKRAFEAGVPYSPSQPQQRVAPTHATSKYPIYDVLRTNYEFTPDHIMPQEYQDCIESTVNNLLAEDIPNPEDPGLLLGKIQCGKTATFEGIIGYAFDRGIDICVVLTKGVNMLSKQTMSRFEKDYACFKNDDNANINIYDVMGLKKKKLMEWKVKTSKTIIICKKEARNMDSLYHLFNESCQFLRDMKVLIVDDEADFASRNYVAVQKDAIQDEEGNITVQDVEVKMAPVSQKIDDFRKLPAYCRYLQVTATPYCLYLQSKEDLYLQGNKVLSFRPRFTSIVPTHSEYVGGQQYFIDSQDTESMYYHLYNQVEQKCIDILGHEDKRYIKNPLSSGNIADLTYALVAYLMATAVRVLQNEAEGKYGYHSSALIHVKLDKDNHDWQRRLVEATLDKIRKAFVDNCTDDKRILQTIDIVWEDFKESNRKGREAVDEDGNPAPLITVELPEYDAVVEKVKEIFVKTMYKVQVVNSDEDVDSLLNDENELDLSDAVANIFIGGNILDRGITIKKMLCFFYGRDPHQQDTVIQHARMYGARSKEDMAVTRFHTTDKIYRILKRMNEMDDQLRQWFIEGKDLEEPNAVFVGFDKSFSPCATSKIKASKIFTIKQHKFFVPSGFFTGNKKEIGSTVEKIQQMIETSPDYANQDANGIFTIDKQTAFEILNLIRSTYVYDEKEYFNIEHKNDLAEMMCVLQQCAGDQLYCLHRTDRNMNRLRADGGFIDAPQDGRTDSAPAKKKAVDMPVIMFIKQNGKKNINEVDRINYGWNNTPFYWPVLLTQKNTDSAMCAIDNARNKQAAIYDVSLLLQDIDPSSVLKVSMPIPGEAADMDTVESIVRAIKDTTASKYIEKDIVGEWALSEGTVISDNWQGVYTLNHGKFPFELHPYKYALIRFGRSGIVSYRLYEMEGMRNWVITPEKNYNEDGDLVDHDDVVNGVSVPKVLVYRTDTLTDKDLNEKTYVNRNLCQWVISYKLKSVIRKMDMRVANDDMDEIEDEA